MSMRPKDAATLILVDNSQSNSPRILMGRRHRKHAFMPGLFVFPGGRTDSGDGRITVNNKLSSYDERLLCHGPPAISKTRAQALALSAIRETYEEAGLFVGSAGEFRTRSPAWLAFAQNNIVPGLSCLHYVARAITPPKQVRRFDTRFFVTFAENIAKTLPTGGPSGELEDMQWLTLNQIDSLELPFITQLILEELAPRLTADPRLQSFTPIPFFTNRNKQLIGS